MSGSGAHEVAHRLDGLAALADHGLSEMYDVDAGLFVNKVVWTDDGRLSIGVNALYSAMVVVGLESANQNGSALSPEVTARTLDELVHIEPAPTGLLATILWALFLRRDNRASAVLSRLDRSFDQRRDSTMELGLVLAALASGLAAGSDELPILRRLGDSAIEGLESRFVPSTRLFRATGNAVMSRGLLERNITSFASQVYPIHGLAQYALAREAEVPSVAISAGNQLVSAQGELGQWWWVFSPRSGSVLDGYPVYSVHQHAMGFMALASLQNAGAGAYSHELALGLDWIYGRNELGASLLDTGRSTVFRCIQRAGGEADGMFGMSRAQWRRTVLSSQRLLPARGEAATAGGFEILTETRPYELGWLLYARSLTAGW